MPIEIPVTTKEAKEMEKALKTNQEVICLDPRAFVVANLVGLEILYRGSLATGKKLAEIVKAYEG